MYRGSDNKLKITIRLKDETFKNMDAAMISENIKSRNEFIESAINYYAVIIGLNKNQNVLADSVERLVSGIVSQAENRIARLQFKQSVELAKLAHMVAFISDADEETIKKLHMKCVDEVKRINGTVSFEDAYRYQKSVE